MKPFGKEKPLILVVDDETEVLEEVAAVLTAANYSCRCCTTAEGAIAASEATRPDLIVSDINLHGHSGLEMCERIKENKALQDVPVMFVSRSQLPDIVRRSHEAGGAYYLRKPLDPDVLLDLVGKALWMPQLVCMRLSMHEPASPPIPRPQTKMSVRAAAVQGIRLPLA